MNNANVTRLRQQYFESIKQLQDKQDIIDNLPVPEYENFFPIMEGLIGFIAKEIEETNHMIQEEKDEDMKEYLQEEQDLWEYKLNACKELVDEVKEMKELEEQAENTPYKDIIFATTPLGNIYLERDLKGVSEEYYEKVKNSLEELKNGYKEENEEKGKQLKNNNKLLGVHEVKPFKVRIMYKILCPDTLFIIMTKMKKGDNEKKDREEVIIRNKQTELEFRKLRKEIKDPIRKKEIIEENQQTYNYLFEYLKEKGRG